MPLSQETLALIQTNSPDLVTLNLSESLESGLPYNAVIDEFKLHEVEKFIFSLKENTYLSVINLKNCLFEGHGLFLLLQALSNHPYVTRIDLTGHRLTQKERLVLGKNRHLTALILKDNSLSDDDLRDFIHEGISLQELNLSHNGLTNASLALLSSSTLQSSLIQLDLSYTQMDDLEPLLAFPQLKDLSLKRLRLNVPPAGEKLKLFLQKSFCEKLDLRKVSFGGYAAKIVHSIAANTHLKALILPSFTCEPGPFLTSLIDLVSMPIEN